MKKILILLGITCLITLSLSSNVFAVCTTNVPPGVISGETWTEAGSPYCVEGNVIVNNLTIEPGVSVEITGDFEFEIVGILTAVGTSVKGITFTTADNIDSWMGIFFNNSLPGSELAYVTIEKSIDSGLEINNSQPTIRDCIIQNNQQVALNRGGGIWTNTSLTLTRCTVSGNYVSIINGAVYGGGIYSQSDLILRDTEVSNNSATASAPFSPSNAAAFGGGIYAGGTLTLERTVVDSNITDATCGGGITSAQSRGGGLYAVSGVTIVNSFITRNEASAGGFCSSQKSGGGIHLAAGGDIIHTTVADNVTQGLNSANQTVIVVNSIFWNNTVAQISGLADVSFSDVQDGFTGTGNINLNPLFIMPDPLNPAYNVHIDSLSSCKDVGTDTFPFLPLNDIDGDSRPQGQGYDMGADEVSESISGPDLIGNVQTFASLNFGSDIIIQLQVENIGNVNAGSFDVIFMLWDGISLQPLSFQTIASGLLIGETTTLPMVYNSVETLSGKFVLSLIDINNIVEEQDETNNLNVFVIP